MKEYKILMTSRNVNETEDRLNEMAEYGWRIVSATDLLIYLEREKNNTLTEG